MNSRFLRRIARASRVVEVQSKALGWLPDLARIVDVESWVAPHGAPARHLSNASSLDLGCGANLYNPFGAHQISGVDVRDDLERNVRKADLATGPIPFGDNQFDFVTARDFVEHVPRLLYLPERRLPFVELMNEVHRVLKPGGMFLSVTPVYPFGPAFQDPTHVNVITDATFPEYFCLPRRIATMYGFRGEFELVGQTVLAPTLISLLRKPG